MKYKKIRKVSIAMYPLKLRRNGKDGIIRHVLAHIIACTNNAKVTWDLERNITG